VPAIEVAFDIDANGIVNVSARDKATGREQAVTVQSSGGLTATEIDAMVAEAEANRATDAALRDRIELANAIDTLAYSAETAVEEHRDKLQAAVRDRVLGAVEAARAAVADAAQGVAELKAARDALQVATMEMGKSLYSK
jgi:molecular chaperone DnaK (HSP70)